MQQHYLNHRMEAEAHRRDMEREASRQRLVNSTMTDNAPDYDEQQVVFVFSESTRLPIWGALVGLLGRLFTNNTRQESAATLADPCPDASC